MPGMAGMGSHGSYVGPRAFFICSVMRVVLHEYL